MPSQMITATMPVFPSKGTPFDGPKEGINLRTYIAVQVLPTLTHLPISPDKAAVSALQYADALIRAL